MKRGTCMQTLAVVVAAAILLAAPGAVRPAAGSTFEWTSPTSGTYGVAGNWTRTAGATIAPPVAGDIANFNKIGTYTITFNAAAASDFGHVSAGSVTFQSTGGTKTYSLTTGSAQLDITASTLTLGAVANPLNLICGGVLNLESAGTLNVKYGSVASTSLLFVGAYGGVGTNAVVVDGAGSSLVATNGGYLGYNGGRGDLTFQNGAGGTFSGSGGALWLGESTGGGTGNLIVQSNADLSVGQISAATTVGTGGAAAITVSGSGSTVTQSGASTLSLGSASGSSAVLNINNNGVFTTGTGLTTVNKTGAVNVTASGRLNAKGDITVNGGAMMFDNSAFFAWDGSRTMNISDGGRLTLNNNWVLPTAAVVNVSGTGSKLEMLSGSYLAVRDGAQVNVTSGGALTGPLYMNIGTGGGNGTLVVDGAGSSVSIGGVASWWGGQGSTASVAFRNGATGSFNGILNIVSDATAGTTATVNVESGAKLTLNYDLNLNTAGGSTYGSVAVTGAGSSITQAAGCNLAIGADSGTAYLSINNGGTYTVSDTGTTYLNKTGAISIDGGSAYLGYLVNNGGSVYFYRGYLNLIGNFWVGVGGVMGDNVMLGGTQRLTVRGDTNLGSSSMLTIDGGTFWTNGLNPSAGTFRFLSGTVGVGLNGAGTFDFINLGPAYTVGRDCYFIVSNAAVLGAGQRVTVDGGRLQTQTLNNSGTITVESGGDLNIPLTSTNQASGSILIDWNSSAYAGGAMTNLGEIFLEGGTAAMTGPGIINNSGLIRGEGRIANPVTNAAAGEIRAEFFRRIRFDGNVGTNAGVISLQGGTAEFAQPLTNGATGFISGRGTLIVGGTGLTNVGSIGLSGGFTDVYAKVANNSGGKIVVSGGATATFYDDVVHNAGATFKVSPGCAAVFFGSLSGDGDFSGSGTVYNEGDLRPGHSPAVVNFGGDLVLGSSASLEIELAGTTPGSGYDQVNVAGTVTLDGAMSVVPLGGYRPNHGDAFSVVTWGARAGTFDAITGLDFGGRLTLTPVYQPHALVLTAVQGGNGEWGVDRSDLSSVPANWLGAMPGGATDTARFASVITAPHTVTIDVPVTYGGMEFDNPNAYTVGGASTLTLQGDGGPAAILVSNRYGNGNHLISAPLALGSALAITHNALGTLTIGGPLDNSSGRTITKKGPGTVIISGPQTHGVGAALLVDQGTVNFNSDAGSPSTANLTVTAGGTSGINFGHTQHLAVVNLNDSSVAVLTNSASNTLITKALTIAGPPSAPTGKLDLGVGRLVVDYTDPAPSPADTIRQWVNAGRAPDPFGTPTWTGNGITSSAAAANVAYYAVGYFQNKAPEAGGYTFWGGDPDNPADPNNVTVDETSVLVRYTWAADINLDGRVNDGDATILGALYDAGLTSGHTWQEGDLNGDGLINDADATILGALYPQGLLTLGPAPVGGSSSLGAVPEPATLALLGLGAVVGLIRRRRVAA